MWTSSFWDECIWSCSWFLTHNRSTYFSGWNGHGGCQVYGHDSYFSLLEGRILSRTLHLTGGEYGISFRMEDIDTIWFKYGCGGTDRILFLLAGSFGG